MASIKSIFRKRLFAQIDNAHLAEFLSPIKDYLVGKNMWLTEENEFPEHLASYLQSADDCPKEALSKVERELYLISLIAKEECSGDIKDHLKNFDANDDIFRLAGKLLLENPQSCEKIASLLFAEQAYNSQYYMPSMEISAVEPLSKSQLESLKTKLEEFFEDEGKSKFAFVFQHDCGEHIYLCVEHGHTRTVEISVEMNKTKNLSYRPFAQDIIRIKKSTGEMVVHLEKDGAKTIKKYKILLGNIIVPHGEMSPYNKFSLEPLRKGKEAFGLGNLDRKINLVVLRKFYFKGRSKNGYIGGDACCDEAKRLGADGVVFSAADLDFYFPGIKKPIPLHLTATHKGKVPICPQYENIEEFLIQNGFLQLDAYEKTIPLG